MNTSTPCVRPESDELAARYAAGSLSGAELADFESHMLECVDCQARVREAAALRVALRRERPSATRRVAVVTLLAAAAIAGLLFAQREDPVRSLGHIGNVMPGFEGLPVRADGNDAVSVADQGMAAYVRGDYAAAAALLTQAAESDPSPGLWFFAGIASLRTGRAAAAAGHLEALAAPIQGPYSQEAAFYLAKAYLAQGLAGAALEALAAVDESGGPLLRRAVALADSVHAARR